MPHELLTYYDKLIMSCDENVVDIARALVPYDNQPCIASTTVCGSASMSTLPTYCYYCNNSFMNGFEIVGAGILTTLLILLL